MEKRLVTAALPYVNNVPHIGNIVGSHLPADIFARYCRIKGYLTLFIGGTDEHGTPIEVQAFKEGLSPQELTDKYFEIHKKIYDWFNFSYDNFSRTSKSKIHYELTKEFFLEMFKNGFLIEQEIELPYDPEAKRFLPDRYVEGKCPYCGYEKAKGDQCEKCGKLLDPKDLIEPKSIITGKPVIFKKTRHLFLDLRKLQEKLKEWLETKKGIFTEQAISMALSWIEEGLKPRSITRDIKWGVPVPYKELWEIVKERIKYKLDISTKKRFVESFVKLLRDLNLVVPEEEIEKLWRYVEEYWPDVDKILNEYNYFEVYKDKVLYVWFDAPIGYISFTIEKLPDRFEKEELEKIDANGIEIEIKEEIYVYKDGRLIGKIKYEEKENEIIIKEIRELEVLRNIEKICKRIYEKTNKEIKLEFNWKEFWCKDAKIYHFIGKDNIPFHTIFWPAMILAFNENRKEKINLPYNVVGLNYLNYEGRKISKSQGWGVFCEKMIDAGLDSDYWRFYLALLIPEHKDTDFTWEEFKEVINKELVNNIGNFVYRVLSFIWKNFNGEIPVGNIDEEVRKKLEEYKNEIESLFESCRLSEALRKIIEFSNYCNKYFQEKEPWKNKEKASDILFNAIHLVKALLIFLYPYIPKSVERLMRILNYEEIKWEKILEFDLGGKKINKPEIPFKKIEDELLNKVKEIVTKI